MKTILISHQLVDVFIEVNIEEWEKLSAERSLRIENQLVLVSSESGEFLSGF